MMIKDKATRDTFALSLGGVTVVTAFSAMPAISYERLRQEQGEKPDKSRQLNWRVWIPRRSRVF